MNNNLWIPDLASCETKEQEYWTHVASQSELPIAAGNEALPLVTELEELVNELPKSHTKNDRVNFIQNKLLTNPNLIHQLRLLVAVSDKRLYLDLSYLFSRIYNSKDKSTLCNCKPYELTRHSTSFFENILKSKDKVKSLLAANAIAQYFIEQGLYEMLQTYSSLNSEQRKNIVTSLILPKEAQQNEAKRRGHGAEVSFAQLVRLLGCKFIPPDKETNPMGHDPNVDRTSFRIAERNPDTTYSFDLLVLDNKDNICICVQGLVQSSDPGQFGVDKSNQTVEIRKVIDEFNNNTSRPIQLWGIVDGVGYSENKEGTINKMLRAFHQFIQMKSIYKVGLGLHSLGLCTIRAIQFDDMFYSQSMINQMTRYVSDDIRIVTSSKEIDSNWIAIPAGKAILYK